jgi:hypothetical protein
VQAAPAAPPVQAPPRQQAAPVAPAGAVITPPPPAPRVQAPAQAPQSPRAGAEDDRKRTGQPRHGERERDATR